MPHDYSLTFPPLSRFSFVQLSEQIADIKLLIISAMVDMICLGAALSPGNRLGRTNDAQHKTNQQSWSKAFIGTNKP